MQRAEQAGRAFTSLETQVAGLDDGELGLDSAHEEALEAKEQVEAELARPAGRGAGGEPGAGGAGGPAGGAAGRSAAQGRHRGPAGGDRARAGPARVRWPRWSPCERLRDSRRRRPRGGGRRGRRDRRRVPPWARSALLKDRGPGPGGPAPGRHRGRADAATTGPTGRSLPEGAVLRRRRGRDSPATSPRRRRRLLRKIALVDGPAGGPHAWSRRCPDLTAVTTEGDLVSTHYVAGGSSAQPSLIEVQAAVDDAEQRLAEAQHRCERLRFGQTELEERLRLSRETGRGHTGPAARVGCRDGRAGRGAGSAQLGLPLGARRGRPAAAGDGPGRGGPGSRPRRAGRPGAPPGAGRGGTRDRGTGSGRARPAGRGGAARRAAPRWTPGWRCEPWRSGSGRWPDAPTPCGAPPVTSGPRRAKAQARRERMLREAEGRRRACTPAPATWRGGSRRPLPSPGSKRAAADAARTDAEAALAEIRRPAPDASPTTSSPWSTPCTATRWLAPSSGCGWRR